MQHRLCRNHRARNSSVGLSLACFHRAAATHDGFHRITMDTQSQNDEVTELSSLVIAIASALPILGIVVYGFAVGWTALGAGALVAMIAVAAAYYLILRQMLRYRQRSTLRVKIHHIAPKS